MEMGLMGKFHLPPLQGRRDIIRLLSQSVPAHGKEVQGGSYQHDLGDKPHVKRELDKLSKLFSGEKPGVGAASMVETLLALHLGEKDVEAIFVEHPSLYTATFTKEEPDVVTAHELIRDLLACNLTRREVGRIIRTNPFIMSWELGRGCIEVVKHLTNELKVVQLAEVRRLDSNTLYMKGSTLRETIACLKVQLGKRDVGLFMQKSPQKSSQLLGHTSLSFDQNIEAPGSSPGPPDQGLFLDRSLQPVSVVPTVPADAWQWLVATLGESAAQNLIAGSQPVSGGPTEPAGTWQWLVATLGESAAQKVIAKSSRVLSLTMETCQQRLSSLREMLPGVDVVAIIVKCPTILTVNPEALVATHGWLVETFAELYSARFVLTCPTLLLLTVPPLQAKLDFITGVLGRSKEDVAAYPLILTRGVESVLKRFTKIQRLGLGHKFKLSTIYSSSNDEFAKQLDVWAQPSYNLHRRWIQSGRDKWHDSEPRSREPGVTSGVGFKASCQLPP
eukprot:jgi/Mesen1/5183/ME000257S04458